MTQGLLGKTELKTHTVIFFLKTSLKNGGWDPQQVRYVLYT